MSQEHIERLREGYALINRKDLHGSRAVVDGCAERTRRVVLPHEVRVHQRQRGVEVASRSLSTNRAGSARWSLTDTPTLAAAT